MGWGLGLRLRVCWAVDFENQAVSIFGIKGLKYKLK